MKQELIDRMVDYIRDRAFEGSAIASAIVDEIDKHDYLVIAREICARAHPACESPYRKGFLDRCNQVQYVLEQLERAAGLRA